MSDESAQIMIGELARRSGLSVRTIRFYSDSGVLAAAGRTEAGYRLYAPEAVAAARLIRTLRELGLDLETIRGVLAGELSVPAVAARHAAALDAQISALQLQRNVLRAIASRPDDPGVIDRMHDLATLTATERRRLIEEFIEDVFGGLPGNAEVRARMESAPPDLPEAATPEQVEAWIELAHLIADERFRARIREMAVRGAEQPEQTTVASSPIAAKAVGRIAGEAVESKIDPSSPAGEEALASLLAEIGEPPDRIALAAQLAAFTDRRVGRYWALIGIVNGWPPVPDVIPAWEWFAAALRAHPTGTSAPGRLR